MKQQLVLAASSVAILMAASSALAVGANRNPVGVNAVSGRTAETITPSNRPMLLAEVRNNCGQETALLSVETKDFWVNICGEETDPRLYVGVNKKTGQAIRLPLKGQNHGIYVAENKGVQYRVDTNRLVVIQGRKVLVDQPVINFE